MGSGAFVDQYTPGDGEDFVEREGCLVGRRGEYPCQVAFPCRRRRSASRASSRSSKWRVTAPVIWYGS